MAKKPIQKPARPVAPLFPLAMPKKPDVSNLSITEIEEIMNTANGRMVIDKILNEERKLNQKRIIENCEKRLKEREDDVMQILGTADFLTTVERLENVFENAGKDKYQKFTLDQIKKAFEKAGRNKNGWRQKYISVDELEENLGKSSDASKKLSVKDVVRGFVDECSMRDSDPEKKTINADKLEKLQNG